MTNQERIQRLERTRRWLVLRVRRENEEEQLHLDMLDEVLEDLRREGRGGLHVLKTPIDGDEELELALLQRVGTMSRETRIAVVEHVLDLEGSDIVLDVLERRRLSKVCRRVGGGER